MINFNDKKWLTLLLMMFLTLICLSAESQTVIQATDTIRDSRTVINDNFEQLFNRRYEDISDPGVNNDGVDTAGIGQEFNKGNIWLNTSTGKYHICTDNSTGAAVWKKITLSASDIKTLYESNSDTNAFTDALLSKLNEIPVNANWVEDSSINGNILIDSAETVVYDDSNVMKLTGDQTASGDKTFNDFVQTGALQATGSSIPSTEGGVEMLYDGVDGMVHSYNRGTSTHMPLNLSGSELDFQIDGTTEGGFNSSGNLFVNNNLLVDTISEKTAANGVEIDGVELKDGGGVFSGNVETSGTLSVDTISEKTSGNGVEIDGVELKDGGAEFYGVVNVGDYGRTNGWGSIYNTFNLHGKSPAGSGALILTSRDSSDAEVIYGTFWHSSGTTYLNSGAGCDTLKLGAGSNTANAVTIHSDGNAEFSDRVGIGVTDITAPSVISGMERIEAASSLDVSIPTTDTKYLEMFKLVDGRGIVQSIQRNADGSAEYESVNFDGSEINFACGLVGSHRTVLEIDSTGIVNMPYQSSVRARKETNTLISSGSGFTTVTGFTEDKDSQNEFNPSTGVFTADEGGDYVVTLIAYFEDNSDNTMRACLVESTSAIGKVISRIPAIATGVTTFHCSGQFTLSAGDTLIPKVSQLSGVSLNLTGIYFQIDKIH